VHGKAQKAWKGLYTRDQLLALRECEAAKKIPPDLPTEFIMCGTQTPQLLLDMWIHVICKSACLSARECAAQGAADQQTPAVRRTLCAQQPRATHVKLWSGSARSVATATLRLAAV